MTAHSTAHGCTFGAHSLHMTPAEQSLDILLSRRVERRLKRGWLPQGRRTQNDLRAPPEKNLTWIYLDEPCLLGFSPRFYLDRTLMEPGWNLVGLKTEGRRRRTEDRGRRTERRRRKTEDSWFCFRTTGSVSHLKYFADTYYAFSGSGHDPVCARRLTSMLALARTEFGAGHPGDSFSDHPLRRPP